MSRPLNSLRPENEINLVEGLEETAKWRETCSFRPVQSRAAFSSEQAASWIPNADPEESTEPVSSSFMARIYSRRVSDGDNAAEPAADRSIDATGWIPLRFSFLLPFLPDDEIIFSHPFVTTLNQTSEDPVDNRGIFEDWEDELRYLQFV